MAELFLKIVNMSISAGWLVLAVVLLRWMLKKAPKWIRVLLWGIVAVRLLVPVSIESFLSLVPSAQTIHPEIMLDPNPTIHSGIPAINSVINPIISQSFAPNPMTSANPLQIFIPALGVLWIVGMTVMLVWTVITYLRLRFRVREAVRCRDHIFLSEYSDSPFVLGFWKPRIYLPYGMAQENMESVIAHEQAHIQRKDHWWKPLGFVLLTVHWFNPVMWVAYILLCRDIELACDEKVIQKLDPQQRADYSQALLACSINRRMIAACPLAFGEVGVKERVKAVLNYRKPGFWILLAAVVACIAIAVGFLTNPVTLGVKEIALKEKGNEFVLEIGYSDLQGYAVTVLGPNEKEYCGDGMVDYDGALGKYRIMITFADTDPSDAFAAKYPAQTVRLLKNIPESFGGEVRVKRVHPSDQGFVLYVGSDVPFSVQSQPFQEPGRFSGTISIRLEKTTPDDAHLLALVEYIARDPEAGVFSSPYMYIHSNRELFNEILSYGDVAVNCFVKAMRAGENGLQGYIMASACAEITGIGRGAAWVNAKGWLAIYDELVSIQISRKLTLEDVLALSKKGEDLVWEDLLPYQHGGDIGSGLYILRYEINEVLSLVVGGGSLTGKPHYANLSHALTEEYVDIRYEDVKAFIETHETDPLTLLKLKFPQYFGLNTEKGLAVCVWQMAGNSYSCSLFSGKDGMYNQEDILTLPIASMGEMRQIVASYGLPRSEVAIVPVRALFSSFYYEIDDAYRAKVEKLFWSDDGSFPESGFNAVIDSAVYDIDGDGKKEICNLGIGPTSGIFTFRFSISGETINCSQVFYTAHCSLAFVEQPGGRLQVLMEKHMKPSEVHYLDISIRDGQIILSENGVPIGDL